MIFHLWDVSLLENENDWIKIIYLYYTAARKSQSSSENTDDDTSTDITHNATSGETTHETDLPTLSSAASTNLQGEVELGAISSSNRCDSEESLEFQPKIVTGNNGYSRLGNMDEDEGRN